MPDPVFRAGFGFETGGNEETAGAAGGPVVKNRAAGPGSPRPEEEYTGEFVWKDFKQTWSFTPGTSDWITVGVYIRFEHDDPGIAQRFLTVRDGAAPRLPYLSLEFQSTAQRVEIFDANDVSKGFTLGWEKDTWYYVLVKFKKQNSADFQLMRHTLLDNGEVVKSELLADQSGFDAEPGGTLLQLRMRQGIDPLSGNAGVKDFHIGNAVIVTDSGANIDSVDTFNSDYTFLVYQNTTQGTARDFGTYDSANVWSNAGELPANDALYALFTMADATVKKGGVYTDDGARTGPNGDSRLPAAGDLFGAVYVWRVVADSGTPKFWGRFGKSAGTPSTTSISWNITAVRDHIQYIDVSDIAMPSSSQYFAIGMDAQAVSPPGGLRMLDMWANLVLRRVTVAAGVPGIIYRGMIDAG